MSEPSSRGSGELSQTKSPDADVGVAETVPSDVDPDSRAPLVARGPLGDELCGRTIQRIRLDALIGQGGMGSVYRGHDLSLDRPVAVKVIRADALARSESNLRDRFLREARAQARLNHPNVVQVHSAGEEGDLLFIVMELVEGESLDDVLARGERLDWKRAIELMLGVADALRAASASGFIHRDIKPSNLLVDVEGTVKVADFGLVKWVDRGARLTDEGAVLGTPLYMSPEQGQGESVDLRSDIYALGATFYHLMTGTPPYEARTALAIIAKQLTERVRPMSDAAPEVPKKLARLIEDRMMAIDVDARIGDFDTLIEALEQVRPRELTPAGFWVRAFAAIVDALVLAPFVISALVGVQMWAPEEDGLYALALLIPYACYLTIAWRRHGQTVGKWLFRIQVLTLDNEKLTLGRGFLRFLALNVGLWLFELYSRVFALVTDVWGEDIPNDHPLANAFNLGIVIILVLWVASFVPAGIRRDGRALHDLLCRTQVVYVM